MKIIKNVLLLSAFLSVLSNMPMDPPNLSEEMVFVTTSDGKATKIERWKINEMKVLLVLLEHQKKEIDYLFAPMIDSQELDLLSNALEAIALGTFDTFYQNMVENDPASKKSSTGSIAEGILRILINAAHRVEATGVSAFCLRYVMPSDMQREQLVPHLMESVKRKMLPIAYNLVRHRNGVDSVAFSPNGNKIVSGGWGDSNNLVLWDISNLTAITHQDLVGYSNSVYSVAFSPDGNKIISGCNGRQNNLILWDISNPPAITHQVLVGHPNDIYSVAFSPDGNKIISGCDSNHNNLILWDISNQMAITHQVLAGHPTHVHSVAFSSDGNKIVSGGYGNQNNLILWDISNPTAITHQVLVGHPNNIYSVAFSPDGNKIISGCYGANNNLILWDISNPTAITHQVLAGHPDSVGSIAFSADGSKIVSSCWGNQNNLILWNISNPAAITHQVLDGHPQSIYSVAFSSDGHKIISGGFGDHNNLILWDISNPTAITHHVLAGHPQLVRPVAFSADGDKIISCSSMHGNLILFSLQRLAEEKKALSNCTFDQAQFIYRISLLHAQGFHIELKSPTALTIFKSLPDNIRLLLQTHFKIVVGGSTSGKCLSPLNCVIL